MADGEVKIDVTVDDSDAKKKMADIGDEAESAAGGLDDLSDSAEGVGDGFGAADVAIGSFVGNALSQLANKVVETVGNIAALAEETREYREDMAKLDTAFTTAGHSTETAQKAYDDFYKLLGESDRSVEAVNHLAELAKTEEQVSQWSTIAAGVTAKFGDSLPIEGLTEAANETAKVGVVTGGLADALNWASMDTKVFEEALKGNDRALEEFTWALEAGESAEDSFNAALGLMYTEEERAAAITGVLNGLYSESAAEYNELTANTQAARAATNNMEQAQAALGAAIEPVTTAWTNMKANALQWFVDTGLPALQTGWQWFQDNLPAIGVIVGGLTAAWLAAGGAQTIYLAIQKAVNASFLSSPIFWVIAGITALVAGFMLLWNNCEGFRNFWIGLWEGIKTVAAAVADWFTEAWAAVLEWFQEVIPAIKDWFVSAWEGIQAAWGAVQDFFSGIWDGIVAVFSVVGEWFSNVFSTAWEGIQTAWSAVKDFFSGVWDGIVAVFSAVGEWFIGIFTAAWEGIQTAWGAVQSFFSGLWEGIKAVFSVVGEWFIGVFTTAWNGIKNVWNGVKSFFSGIWNGIVAVFSVVGTWFKQKFTDAWNGIKSVWNGVKSFFSGVWSGITSVFASVSTWFKQKFTAAKDAIISVFSNIGAKFLAIGKNIVTGIWNGISNSLAWIKGKITGWVGNVMNFFKSILGIHSPSTWFRDEIGKMIALGIAVGITEEKDTVIKAAEDVVGSLKGAVSKYKEGNVKTIKEMRGEYNAELKASGDDVAAITGEQAETLRGIDKKWREDKAKTNQDLLDLDTKYAEDLAALEKKYIENTGKKNQSLLDGDEKYKEDVAKKNKDLIRLDEDYAEDIAELDRKLRENKQKENADLAKLDADYAIDKGKIDKKYREDRADKVEELGKLERNHIKDTGTLQGELLKLDAEYAKDKEKLAEDLKKDKDEKNGDLVKLDVKYYEDIANAHATGAKKIEEARTKHGENLVKIEDNINKAVIEKVEELNAFGDKYKDEAKKLWEDLEKSVTELQENYDSKLADRTKSIAASMDLWSEATKNRPSVSQLMGNLKSQVQLLESYNEAIDTLSERNINPQLLQELKEMGVDATGEIQTLARMSDENLETYVAMWEEKQRLANEAALEEMEPLKAETDKKIQELTDTAIGKYDEMRAKFKEEGGLLAAETRQAIIDAETGMYNELIGEIDTFTEAGAALMDGIALGIMERAPLLAQAAADAVNGIVGATQKEGEIASPSKLMKREVGYNLADGVLAGWTDKIGAIKNKMAADMQGLTARIKTAVTLENARMTQGVGVRDTGFTDIAQAVGMQTAGINSLASEFRHGSNAQVTVPLVLDGRELGRAVVQLGNTENTRIGKTLVRV